MLAFENLVVVNDDADCDGDVVHQVEQDGDVRN